MRRQSATVDCPKSMIGRIIGKNGETIKALQAYTGALIQIDQSVEPTKITISGTPQSLLLAVSMVVDIVKGTFKGFALLRRMLNAQMAPAQEAPADVIRPVYSPGYGLIPPAQIQGAVPGAVPMGAAAGHMMMPGEGGDVVVDDGLWAAGAPAVLAPQPMPVQYLPAPASPYLPSPYQAPGPSRMTMSSEPAGAPSLPLEYSNSITNVLSRKVPPMYPPGPALQQPMMMMPSAVPMAPPHYMMAAGSPRPDVAGWPPRRPVMQSTGKAGMSALLQPNGSAELSWDAQEEPSPGWDGSQMVDPNGGGYFVTNLRG